MKSTGKLVIAILATLILSGAAIGGVVLAQSPTSAPPGQAQPQAANPTQGAGKAKAAARQGLIDDFLNQLAQNLHIDRATLNAALKSAAGHEVDQAVKNGKLTPAQATAIKQRIESGDFPIGFDIGRAGKAGQGRAVAACKPETDIATALGITQSELQQARKRGQSLEQIAQAHGKTLQDVQNALAASVKSCLDPQVQSGKLSQKQENDIIQRIQQRGSKGSSQ